MSSSDELRQSLSTPLGFRVQPSPSKEEIQTFYELLSFFTHLTLRLAFGSKFSEQQMAKLQDYLGPMLAFIAVNAFFAHWPEEQKNEIRSDFIDNLNSAEMEYSKCGSFIGSEDPLDEGALVGRLVKNLTAFSGSGSNALAKLQVATAVLKTFDELRLDTLVEEAHGVIDSVDPEEIAAFWVADAE